MLVITSHLNLDFDGYASAHLLSLYYSDSVLVFPGSKEKKLRTFLSDIELKLAREYSLAELGEMGTVSGMVVTDTSSKRRIGKLSALLDTLPRDSITLFDHHIPPSDMVEAGHVFRQYTGATTSIVVQFLKDMNVDIPADYATLGLMGIYEDTDFLSFPATTFRDADAVSSLLKQGADLNVVTLALKHPLSVRQIELFNQLVPLIERYQIKDRPLAVTQFITDQFEPDISSITHRLMELEDLSLFFCILQMENKTYLIARNLYDDIDLKKLFHNFDGGGHKNIFTAIFKNKTVLEVRLELDRVLESLPSFLRAKDIASPPVAIVEWNEPVSSVFRRMNQLRVNSLPVRDEKGDLTGVVTRQDVDYSILHKFERLTVSHITRFEVTTVAPEDDVEWVRDMFIEKNVKMAFLMENGEVTGIITRTAAFRNAVYVNETRLKRVSYAERLRRILPENLLDIINTAGKIADERGVKLYIVGGFVRDLLLRKPNQDLDFVVNRDGIGFAKILAAQLNARCVAHEKFNTAVLIAKDGMRLDVATSRFEVYDKPGALPDITSATIFHDLYRRDFTINAMAIRLNRDGFGELIDYFGGRRDLKDGIIRVLHSLSFIDDPTRMIRAIRFKHRLKFRIGKGTLSLMKSAVSLDVVEKVSGHRFLKEIQTLFTTRNASLVLEDLEKIGGLRFFHKALKLDPFARNLAANVDSVVAWHRLLFRENIHEWLLYLFALLIHATKEQKLAVSRKLSLGKLLTRQIFRFRGCIRGLEIFFGRKGKARRSQVLEILGGLEPEILLFALAYFEEEGIKRIISDFITSLKYFPFYVNGKELIARGVKSGPKIREILDEVHRRVVDRDIRDKAGQLEVLESLLNPREKKT
ncbi:MAG: CBS domain-containing protein [Acidobacteria bacterium]|nr:CBS domain-containing protein [Acidobacteriota bacterium]